MVTVWPCQQLSTTQCNLSVRRGSDLSSVGRGKAIFPLEMLTLSGNIFGREEQQGCCVVFGEADENVTQLSLEGSYLSIIFVFFWKGQQGCCCVVLGEADENVTQLSLEGSYAAAVHVGESLRG